MTLKSDKVRGWHNLKFGLDFEEAVTFGRRTPRGLSVPFLGSATSFSKSDSNTLPHISGHLFSTQYYSLVDIHTHPRYPEPQPRTLHQTADSRTARSSRNGTCPTCLKSRLPIRSFGMRPERFLRMSDLLHRFRRSAYLYENKRPNKSFVFTLMLERGVLTPLF